MQVKMTEAARQNAHANLGEQLYWPRVEHLRAHAPGR